jgi:DnaJ-domain-containing protein 1
LHKDRDQLIHDFDRLRVAPGSYRRTNGEPRNDPGLAEHYYKTEAHFEQQREEAKYRHADINLRPADTNSAQPKRTQETRSQQPGLPYTEASPSMSRPSQNYAELRRPSYYSGKPEVSSTNTYRESLSPFSRKETLDRSGTDSYQDKLLSSSRREEKPKSSRSGRYDDVDDNYDIRYKKPCKVAPPPPIKEELPNHYATLGISPDASQAEIKKAAKTQRIKVHPDKCKNAGMSEAELKKVDERAAQVGHAAEVLLDPEQKADYDRDCRNARRRNARVRS